MKLYFTPRTRATRARWLLEELGVPYELVKVEPSKGDTSTPEYLALNPFGQVPTLVDGDVTLFESSAICMHLADRFPEHHLAPPVGSAERAAYYQWIAVAEDTVEPVVLDFFRHARLPEGQQAEAPLSRQRLNAVLAVVDSRLDGREFLVGAHFTAADVVMASILHLAHTLKLLEGHPRLVDYVTRHTQRPAVRRAGTP
ncbi:glutathione S-transferase family protein [Corallococcus silvisoli]|uniref:glutathione S-transferase family protein n=1 Tax=Corallococcus silvisoli TaxID=2697031 RepID=UPI001376B4D2|nr:glutathione S-transferase family protein [Corallococcus silvisoli]NBD11179.1 glutathione S-transferase family protein [Corallococcus silvisoli]